MMPKLFSIAAFSLFILSLFIFIHSKERTITGVVYDHEGIEVVGATVSITNHPEISTVTDVNGAYSLAFDDGHKSLSISYVGYETKTVTLSDKSHYETTLDTRTELLDEIIVMDSKPPTVEKELNSASTVTSEDISIRGKRTDASNYYVDGIRIMGKQKSLKKQNHSVLPPHYPEQNREQYEFYRDNPFKSVQKEPLSTLSIDVDRASYSNIRRFLQSGNTPPVDAVRIEEMINYFNYDYPQPKKTQERPFATHIELGPCAWNADHQILQVGIQGRDIDKKDIPPSNFVFLIDVSGSMNSPNKLPLLKSAYKLLVNQLRDEDQVAIVVYAGAAGTVLEPTKGTEKEKIVDAIENLRAGGSTAGAQGILLAYDLAKKHFLEEGNNRVILATDGDFNVGVSNDDELVRLIEKKRDEGIFLSIMAFGQGNYQDAKMQKLANHGNGNHSYIDNMSEAKKVLMEEFGSTLFTIAKDVKIQIEFNPNVVGSYRLVGYENRVLAAEDFNDDKKDAGEMGAGHSVTVLYELIPPGKDSKYTKEIDDLKYQDQKGQTIGNSSDLATIKYRYKKPDAIRSTKSEEVIANQQTKDSNLSDEFLWANAVAEFGMLLRNSDYQENASYEHVIEVAEKVFTEKPDTYKGEFIELVKLAKEQSYTLK